MEVMMKEEDFIVSKTDLNGKITYVNRIFMQVAGYREAELLGQPHNIIRHQAMPRIVFKLLWDRMKAKEEIFAYVLNKTKQGDEYWVFANVTPSFDDKGKAVGYYSVRRMPNPKALEIIKPLYKAMLEAENKGGIDASKKLLDNILDEKGVGYDELIISLQQ